MSETPGKETQEMEGRDGISDSETDQVTTSFMRNTMVSSTMVSGEASETDDEDDDDDDDIDDDDDDNKPGNVKEDKNSDTETESKHLKDEQIPYTEMQEFELDTSTGVKAKRQRIIKFKFDSPFHRKLRERNLELRSDLVEGLTQCYKSAGSKLESSTFHLSRAQTAAQDVSHNTRMMLEDLNTLSTLLESVLGTEKLLPLKINVNYPLDSA